MFDGTESHKRTASSSARQQLNATGPPRGAEVGAQGGKPFCEGTDTAVQAVAGMKRARGAEADKRVEKKGRDAAGTKKVKKVVPEEVRKQVIEAYRNLVHARGAKGVNFGRVVGKG